MDDYRLLLTAEGDGEKFIARGIPEKDFYPQFVETDLICEERYFLRTLLIGNVNVLHTLDEIFPKINEGTRVGVWPNQIPIMDLVKFCAAGRGKTGLFPMQTDLDLGFIGPSKMLCTTVTQICAEGFFKCPKRFIGTFAKPINITISGKLK